MTEMELEDVGYVKLRLKGEDGTVSEHTLDVYEVLDRVRELYRLNKDKSEEEQTAAVAGYFRAQGLPPMSGYLIDRLIVELHNRVADLKKAYAGEVRPASPASMG